MDNVVFGRRLLLAAAIGLAIVPLAQAQCPQILFQEDFQSGTLDQWVGKGGGPHHGQVVPDPLDCTGANQVMNFTATNYGGDIFIALPVDISCLTGTFVLSFDYLGLADGDPNPRNLGGFIGICTNQSPASEHFDHFWLAGTDSGAVTNGDGYTATVLTDNGTWQHYDLDFTSIVTNKFLTSIYIMSEQWSGAGGNPGHVYFDNIQLKFTPCP